MQTLIIKRFSIHFQCRPAMLFQQFWLSFFETLFGEWSSNFFEKFLPVTDVIIIVIVNLNQKFFFLWSFHWKRMDWCIDDEPFEGRGGIFVCFSSKEIQLDFTTFSHSKAIDLSTQHLQHAHSIELFVSSNSNVHWPHKARQIMSSYSFL